MFEEKKETINLQNINTKKPEEISENENVTIHTMQDDINALSGIFPKDENISDSGKMNEVSERKKSPINEKYFNPFLDNQALPVQEKASDFPSKQDTSLGIKTDAPSFLPAKENQSLSGDPSKTPGLSSESSVTNKISNSFAKKLIWITAAIIIVVASGFGGYYFWENKKTSDNQKNQTNNTVSQENNTIQEEIKTEENEAGSNTETANIESIPKYLSDKPNSLSIDMDNPSYDNFKSSISQVAEEISRLGIKEPVEFTITNSEKVPVYFPIFKTISGMKLSDNLMKILGNNFSLFAYHDSDKIRMAVSIEITDKTKIASVMKIEESKLPEELASLFFEGINIPKNKIEFNDNNYKGINVRYYNLSGSQSTIDYAVIGDKLILGTSKNSMLTAIDRILDGQN